MRMNIDSSIVLLLSLSFLIYISKSAQCQDPKPYRCGSDWNDANTKCGECCFSPGDCTTPGDNCFAHVATAPCDGSPATSRPTASTPSPVPPPTPVPTSSTPPPTSSTPVPTSSTPSPTPSTPSPVGSQVTPAPTSSTPSPTNITPAPSDSTPSPVDGAVTCASRCGAGWNDANTKCGQCCTSWNGCSTSGENCYGGLNMAPCAVPPAPAPRPTSNPILPTATPIAVPTAATPAPIDGNVIGNYRLATISGCGTGKYVSLTFDDGPAEQNEATSTIINKLNNHGIVATFYVSPAAWGDDEWGLRQRCTLIQQLHDAGNEIQSHSWGHPNFKNDALTNAQVKIELDTTRDFIVDCGGLAPTIFRPPYGSLSKQQAEYIVGDLRYIIGLWNLDSNDWRDPNDFTQMQLHFDLNKFNGDSVNVLMHDRNVYQIVDDIINLFNNGYEFITQSECYRRCDTIDSDGVCMDTHGQNLYTLADWR